MSYLYFQKILNAKYSLLTLISLSILLAFWGLWYGLPLHLIGDEESVIGGALKMLELRVFVPSLLPEAFDFLYYPVLIPYLIIIFSLPSIIFQWFASGFSVQYVIDYFALHQESVWIAARLISVVASGCMVYVTYKLGELVYNRAVGLIAGIFLATSFLHTQAGHFPRHWMLATLFAYATSYVTLRYTVKRDVSWWLPATLAGISVGVSYISLFCFAFIAPYLIYKRKAIPGWFQKLVSSAVIFFCIAAVFVLLHVGELVDLLGTEDGSALDPKNVIGWWNTIVYGMRTLLRQDPWLFFCSLAGLALVPTYRKNNVIMGVLTIAYLSVLYFIFHIETRYVYFIVPGLALVGASFIDYILQRRFRSIAFTIVACGFIYAAAVVVRYDILLSRPDARLLATQWIEHTMKGAEFIVSSRSLVLPRSREALERENTRGNLRSAERYLLEHFDRLAPLVGETYSYSNIHFWTHQDEAAVVDYIQTVKPRYAVIEYPFEGSPDPIAAPLAQGSVVEEFTQSEAGEYVDINGNFFVPSSIVFHLKNLGPMVRIYQR